MTTSSSSSSSAAAAAAGVWAQELGRTANSLSQAADDIQRRNENQQE
jgi:hypothetical protein